MADGRLSTRGKQRAQEEDATGDDGLRGVAEAEIPPTKLSPRGVHLRGLLRVFHNRSLGWAAFGVFLHDLVETSVIRSVPMSCRHQPPPPRAQDPSKDMFPRGTVFPRVDDSKFWLGAYLRDEGKLPCRGPPSNIAGISAHTGQGANTVKSQLLRRLARTWIREKHNEWSNQDVDSEEGLQIEDLQECILWYVTMEHVQDDSTQDVIVIEDQSADPEDLTSPLSSDRLGASVMGSRCGTNTTTSSARGGYGKGSKNVVTDASRMPVHVVGYLAQFWNNPPVLRRETLRVMGLDPSSPGSALQILHLCGCGTRRALVGESAITCSEGTHLVLGSASLNRQHEAMHHALKMPFDKASYKRTRDDVRRRIEEGRGGLFPGFFGPVPF